MIKILFYILIAYLPFQIALNPYSDIDLMSGRVLILALFFYWLWTIRGSFKAKIRRFLNFQSILLLTLLFFAFISLLFAKEVFWGIRKILVFCSIFPLYFLTVDIIKEADGIKKVFKILVFSSLPIAIIGILQFFAQFVFLPGEITNFWTRWISPIFYGRAFGWLVSLNPSWIFEMGGRFYIRAISIFPDPHTFAFYLGFIIPLALGLLIFTRENRKLLLATILILFAALFSTFSRGGYFAMLGTFIFFALLFIFRRSLKISKQYKILLFAVCCLLFVWRLFLRFPDVFIPVLIFQDIPTSKD